MIYYKNNYGQTVNLTEWPYMMSESDLFDYEWLYESKSSSNPKVSRFYREITEKSVVVSVAAYTKDMYDEAVLHLLEVTDKDVINMTQGRLYVGEEYFPCYFIKSKISDYYPGVNFLVDTFTIISEKGAWLTEKTKRFLGNRGESGNYLDFSYDYMYDYASGMDGQYLNNNGFSESDFEITIFGGCDNPEIDIAGHKYGVICELEAGEYIKINSVTKKVYKVKLHGEVVNLFNYRNRDYYIFRKVPPGKNTVTCNGSFNFNITIYEERSRPTWT